MRCGVKLRCMAAGFIFAALSGAVCAQDGELNLSLPPSSRQAKDLQSFMLVSSNEVAATAKTNIAPANLNSDFKAPWISGNKAHEYLGLATILSVVATSLTAPEGCHSDCSNQQSQTSGTHQSLGRATRALALTTVATGLLFHRDDMHLFEDGLGDPDTEHWLLGGAGALILANAVSKAPARSHSGQAELGAAMMLVAIKLTW